MHSINIRDLRYLCALAAHRHFGRAAAACHVSQPTLSAQLKKLEDTLGVRLLERVGRRSELTPAGEAVVERARRVLRELDDLVMLARARQDPLAGPLSLGFIPTLGPYLMPFVVPVLHARLPRLELALHEDQTRRLLERVRAGELDAAVLALPVENQGLETVALFEEPFLVAVPAGHRLARAGALSVESLEGETLLLLEDGHCLRDQALEVCGRIRTERRDFRATSLETLRHMVAAGGGITLLPKLATGTPAGHEQGLAVCPFEPPAPVRRIGMVWRRSAVKRQALDAIAGHIRETMTRVLGENAHARQATERETTARSRVPDSPA